MQEGQIYNWLNKWGEIQLQFPNGVQTLANQIYKLSLK